MLWLYLLLVFFGNYVQDDLGEQEDAKDVNILLFLEIEILQSDQNVFGIGQKLLFVVLCQHC